MDARKPAFELPPLPHEYVIETSVSTALVMQWDRAKQIRPPEVTAPVRVLKAVEPQKDPKGILARCSAAEIDQALLAARAKDRKWILSMLLDSQEG